MQRIFFAIVGVALAAALIGAIASFFSRGNGTAATTSTQSAAVAVPFTEITHGSKSTVETRVNYLITSTDELDKLWKMINATGTPPAIDFKTHAVIAVFAGKEPSAAIAVSKIEDLGARTVSITIMKPDSACAQKRLAPSPYDIVAMPTTSLPLTHSDISMTIGCP